MSMPANAVIEECRRLRKSIQPISDKYHGFLDQTNCHNTLFPFVLLLGNHSSGKSSFINHLLQRKIQTTGVAPTDDNFTIIGPGEEDIDRNGPALVGDPDLGFSSLQMFGPVLVNHTQLKVRARTAVKDFMIVDSPGMIDSPVTAQNMGGPVGIDRGYNFEGVVRWYAERADVILLFFDPDKPGTTGETLSILTTSLVGLEHKMHIILNKADQFHKIHDFARAYGSLCWNISKVIRRKDLPRIHTMCLPVSSNNKSNNSSSSSSAATSGSSPGTSATSSSANAAAFGGTSVSKAGSSGDQNVSTSRISRSSKSKSFFDQGIHDLEESRAEVIRETLNAPRRRVDNEISRLTESVSSLRMHCRIMDKVVEMYRSRLWRARLLTVLSGASFLGLTLGINYIWDAIADASTSTTTSTTVVGAGTASSETPATARKSIFSMFGNRSSSIGSTSTSTRSMDASSLPSYSETAGSAAAAVTRRSFLQELFGFDSKKSVLFTTGLMGAAVTSVVALWENLSVQRLLSSFESREAFEVIYAALYSRELKFQDEFTIAMGELVLSELPLNISAEKIKNAIRVTAEDSNALGRILQEDIANLRRRASPSFPGSTALVVPNSPPRQASTLTSQQQLQQQQQQLLHDESEHTPDNSVGPLMDLADSHHKHTAAASAATAQATWSYEDYLRSADTSSNPTGLSAGMSGAMEATTSAGALQAYFSPELYVRSQAHSPTQLLAKNQTFRQQQPHESSSSSSSSRSNGMTTAEDSWAAGLPGEHRDSAVELPCSPARSAGAAAGGEGEGEAVGVAKHFRQSSSITPSQASSPHLLVAAHAPHVAPSTIDVASAANTNRGDAILDAGDHSDSSGNTTVETLHSRSPPANNSSSSSNSKYSTPYSTPPIASRASRATTATTTTAAATVATAPTNAVAGKPATEETSTEAYFSACIGTEHVMST